MTTTKDQRPAERRKPFLRIYTPFSAEETRQIDAWGFSQMIRDAEGKRKPWHRRETSPMISPPVERSAVLSETEAVRKLIETELRAEGRKIKRPK